MATHPTSDVAVIGGGVVGLAVAWSAASSGLSVTVCDPAPGSGASDVAAGMLAPVTEALWGEEELLRLNLASAAAWPEFAERLVEAAGTPIGYRRCGTLVVGLDASDRVALEDLHRFQLHLGLDAEWCSAADCRRLEPLLTPSLRGGILAPADHQVDNRLTVSALVAACSRAGVRMIAERGSAVESERGSVVGVRLDRGDLVPAAAVVLAAGCWSSQVGGIPPDAVPAVRPVKGQILRMRGPGGGDEAVLTRSVRALASGRSVYLVPRADGRLVVGSTVEERGFDTTVTAGAVYELVRDAQRALPVVAELELAETSAGLRPGTPDNVPIVGRSAVDGLLLASGHGRNGFLLAPITAELVLAALAGEELGDLGLTCSPLRPAATRRRGDPRRLAATAPGAA